MKVKPYKLIDILNIYSEGDIEHLKWLKWKISKFLAMTDNFVEMIIYTINTPTGVNILIYTKSMKSKQAKSMN